MVPKAPSCLDELRTAGDSKACFGERERLRTYMGASARVKYLLTRNGMNHDTSPCVLCLTPLPTARKSLDPGSSLHAASEGMFVQIRAGSQTAGMGDAISK